MTSESIDGRSGTTRQQILRAAARQFAQRAYHDVGLDDILAEAELTKGAMYFHFRSKLALALAVIEQHTAAANAVVEDLRARNLAGLETLIDFTYLIAVEDIGEDVVRAGLNLLATIGASQERYAKVMADWVDALAGFAQRAIAEGDVAQRCVPQDIGHLVVSVYVGLRQTSKLDDPKRFLRDLEKSWALLLPAILQPDRIEYFRPFISRRTTLAIRAASSTVSSS